MQKEIEKLLKDNISCEYHHRYEIKNTAQAITDYIESRLLSEEEIGLLLFMTWNKYTYKEAKEYWTGRHIRMTTKTVSAKLALAIHKAQRNKLKEEK